MVRVILVAFPNQYSYGSPTFSSNPKFKKLVLDRPVSGMRAVAEIEKRESETVPCSANHVLVESSGDVHRFFAPAPKPEHKRNKSKGPLGADPLVSLGPDGPGRTVARRPYLIVLDGQRQAELEPLARRLVAALREKGREARVMTYDPLDLIDYPLRWKHTSRDQKYRDLAENGKRILHVRSLSTQYGELPRLHPLCGWSEPGAKFRIYRDVILLGNERTNRYIRDLVSSGVVDGCGEKFKSPGSAMVNVVFDAFTPHRHALLVMAPEKGGIDGGIDRTIAMLGASKHQQASRGERENAPEDRRMVSGNKRVRLPDPINNLFGPRVWVRSFTEDGGLFAGGNTQASNYFMFGPEGEMKQHWKGVYGARLSGRGDFLWINPWWGVSGFTNKLICADTDLKLRWMTSVPRHSPNVKNWRYPGTRVLNSRRSNDIFVAGKARLARVNPEGEVLWSYNDIPTCRTVRDFRYRRNLMTHGLSPDDKHLLVTAYGIRTYARYLTEFIRPTVILVNAETGETEWEKKDVLIDHSACRFSGDRIVLADARPGHKELMVCDLDGKTLWSMPRPEGTSRARLLQPF